MTDRKHALSAAELLEHECIIREMDFTGTPWAQLSRVIAFDCDLELYNAYSDGRGILTDAAALMESHGHTAMAEKLRALRDGRTLTSPDPSSSPTTD